MIDTTTTRLLLSTILLATFTYVTFYFIRFFLDLRRRLKYLREFPTTPGHWLFGHVYDFPGPNDKGLAWLVERSARMPDGIRLVWFGPFMPVVVCSGPDTVKAILKTSEPKPRRVGGYATIFPWLGDGLLLSGGSKWARNRRLLTPAFHFDILRPYMNVNNKSTDVFLEKLEAFAKKGEYIEISNHVSLLTLDIILRCAFSYANDCQVRSEKHPYVQAINRLAENTVYRSLRPWLYPSFIFNVSPKGRQFNKDCHYVHSVSEDIIQKRKETLATDGLDTLKKSRYLDFLDILLTAKDENGVGLSDREIRDEVDTFLFEGHDTTASGISWTLYSLAKHPEHQTLCQREVDDILRDKQNKDIEWDDLPRLNHLTLCIKESLRLHNVVPFLNRQMTRDLDVGGKTIPAGTVVGIHLYVLHHSAQVWEEPEEFRPERFSPDNASKMDNYAFVPFSAGPRNCIGQHFAMHEMKTIIAKILSRFTLTLDPDRPVGHRLVLVMKTEDGMYMKATPRHTTPATSSE